MFIDRMRMQINQLPKKLKVFISENTLPNLLDTQQKLRTKVESA